MLLSSVLSHNHLQVIRCTALISSGSFGIQNLVTENSLHDFYGLHIFCCQSFLAFVFYLLLEVSSPLSCCSCSFRRVTFQTEQSQLKRHQTDLITRFSERLYSHLYLNVAHFCVRPYEWSPHHGGEDVVREIRSSKATLHKLRRHMRMKHMMKCFFMWIYKILICLNDCSWSPESVTPSHITALSPLCGSFNFSSVRFNLTPGLICIQETDFQCINIMHLPDCLFLLSNASAISLHFKYRIILFDNCAVLHIVLQGL